MRQQIWMLVISVTFLSGAMFAQNGPPSAGLMLTPPMGFNTWSARGRPNLSLRSLKGCTMGFGLSGFHFSE